MTKRTIFMRIQTMLILTIAIALTSCDKDFINNGGGSGGSVSLKFDLHATQSQMGTFTRTEVVNFKGKIWSVCGASEYAPRSPYSTVWSSNDGRNWDSITSHQFEKRTAHSLTVFKNKMWLLGGVDDVGNTINDISYSPDGQFWTTVPVPPQLGTVANHSAFVFNDKLFVLKGGLANSMEVVSSEDGLNWVNETQNAFPKRFGQKTVVFNNRIYAIGGTLGTIRNNDIWESNDGTNWTLTATNGPIFSPRYGHSATVYDDKVWVVCGENLVDGGTFDIWYSETMDSWTEYGGSLPVPTGPLNGLLNHAALSYKGELWLLGGEEHDGPIRNTTGKIRSFLAY